MTRVKATAPMLQMAIINNWIYSDTIWKNHFGLILEYYFDVIFDIRMKL